ncbi:maleate cis-trans isomerase family protein [Gordonia lacunae]|uniref:Maleate cis-trans isomerase n=1 Tax=Gordonia lacunae TaxID=417102 RepID=A0A243Q8L2_9ACTN|nr:maleate cis-trans isomerase [Gordonia lacunae]OUC78091.1 maleate cis-trans isomerase [Gordonia lacunae]
MNRRRIGLIVPSSNTTVETELPAILTQHPDVEFSFHSSRVAMTSVSPDGLAAMNAQRQRASQELADASTDLVLYACLVALMAGSSGEHRRAEGAISGDLAQRDAHDHAQVRSSAGALLEALRALDARRVALVTPYMRPLAQRVVSYLEAEGVEVVDWRALEVEDNAAVGRIPGDQVLAAARSLDLRDADALILSCCVQMPSLPLIGDAEREFGLPVLSAATAGAFSILRALRLPTTIDGYGALLNSPDATAGSQ